MGKEEKDGRGRKGEGKERIVRRGKEIRKKSISAPPQHSTFRQWPC